MIPFRVATRRWWVRRMSVSQGLASTTGVTFTFFYAYKVNIVLSKVVTTTRHRRRGVGSLLLQQCIKMADEMGLPCILEGSNEG